MTEPVTYLACVQGIAAATEQLRAALAADDWEQALACLEERQRLMDRADRLPDSARRPEEGEAAARILQQVAALDRGMSATLETALAATRGDIEQSQRARETVSAYRNTYGQNRRGMVARFVDQQR